MKKIEILKNIWLVSFYTQEDLALSFLRFQEYYESPRFRGQTFSLDEFKTWYAAENGSFSYVDDWSGFNIPSSVFGSFKRGDFDPLSGREKALISAFDGEPQPFYVIGTNEGSDALEHEICHALFYVDSEYRSAAKKIISDHLDQLAPIFLEMTKMGYHQSVHVDEVHAYASANPDWLRDSGLKCDRKITQQLQDLKRAAVLRNKI
jgi:hypothetical protein